MNPYAYMANPKAYYTANPAEKCFGPAGWQHRKGCSVWHPKCRWRRVEAYGPPCTCSAYHFPHREHSGSCAYAQISGGMPANLFNSPSFASQREEIHAEYAARKAYERGRRLTKARGNR